MQLRAAFTHQQYPDSGGNVVAVDGLRIIRYILFCFSPGKDWYYSRELYCVNRPHIIVSSVKISHAKSEFSSVQNIGCISGSCHRMAVVLLL